MPELFKNFTRFNGECHNARIWLEKLNSAQMLHNLPDSYMFEIARDRLIEGARSKIEIIDTWDDFKNDFEATVVVKEGLTAKWKQMVERTQLRAENINKYYYDKVKLCKELGLEQRNRG